MAHRHEALLNEPCAHCTAEHLVVWPDGSYYDVEPEPSTLRLLIEATALVIVVWIGLVALLGAR